jgi:alkylation response protein AidB-like acyl-CoA dehydrogenase
MATPDEIRSFAESIATAITRTLPEPPTWHPSATEDDASPELSTALENTGWSSLAEDPELVAFAGPGGVELGRRLAPVCDIDVLLGGSPLAGDLIRYGERVTHAVQTDDGQLELLPVTESRACSYSDAFGVHEVIAFGDAQALRPEDSHARIAVWTAAAVGCGLRLLALRSPDQYALAYAGPALCAVTSTCQQIAGAIGFTLEFPLQRAYRRARALSVWNEAVLDGLREAALAPAS